MVCGELSVGWLSVGLVISWLMVCIVWGVMFFWEI